MRKRLDILLVEKGLTRSRTLAAGLVRSGQVLINGIQAEKPALLVSEDVDIAIKKKPLYVGRGGLKLAHALLTFGVNVKDFVVADVGASTGGFTDCLLQNGAQKVYAIDVGHGQLVSALRNDSRVLCMEGVDVRKVSLPELVDLAVVDVSFVSVANVLPSIVPLLKKDGSLIILIKPQFEVGKGRLGKGGVVRDKELQDSAKESVIEKVKSYNLSFSGATPSPILGGSGNKEYLVYFRKNV